MIECSICSGFSSKREKNEFPSSSQSQNLPTPKTIALINCNVRFIHPFIHSSTHSDRNDNKTDILDKAYLSDAKAPNFPPDNVVCVLRLFFSHPFDCRFHSLLTLVLFITPQKDSPVLVSRRPELQGSIRRFPQPIPRSSRYRLSFPLLDPKIKNQTHTLTETKTKTKNKIKRSVDSCV